MKIYFFMGAQRPYSFLPHVRRVLILVSLLGAILHAQDSSALSLSPTVTTASALEENANLASSQVLSLTREQIQALGVHQLSEVMARIPGAQNILHPATSSFAQVGMQGLGGEYVKVLINGVEVSGDVGGVALLDLLPLSDIERIEILPGASSALYGSDAMGGVINIITRSKRSPQGWRGELSQQASSSQLLYGQATSSFAKGHSRYLASASWTRDPGSRLGLHNLYGNPVDIYPMPQVGAQSARLQATLRSGRQSLDYTGSFRRQTQVIRDATLFESAYEDLSWEATAQGHTPLSARSDLEVDLSAQRFDHTLRQTNLNFSTQLAEQPTHFQDWMGTVRWIWRASEYQTVLIGLAPKLETLRSLDFPSPRRDPRLDFFAQDLLTLGSHEQWVLAPGFRVSDVWTPKFSVRYAPDSNNVLRMAYGMGYREPSLKQRYWVFFHQAPYNFLLVGNPALLPERSHSLNASWERAMGAHAHVSASAFANYLYDRIVDQVVDSSSGSAYDESGVLRNYIQKRTYVNQERARTAGGSLELHGSLAAIDWQASYSYTISQQKENGHWLNSLYESPRQVLLALNVPWKSQRASAHVEGRWSEAPWISQAPWHQAPDFWMLNSSLEKSWGQQITLRLGVENILDNWNLHASTDSLQTSQEDYYGLHYGRTWTVALNWKFDTQRRSP